MAPEEKSVDKIQRSANTKVIVHSHNNLQMKFLLYFKIKLSQGYLLSQDIVIGRSRDYSLSSFDRGREVEPLRNYSDKLSTSSHSISTSASSIIQLGLKACTKQHEKCSDTSDYPSRYPTRLLRSRCLVTETCS